MSHETNIDPAARAELAAIHLEYPETIREIARMDGELGRLAKLCIQCAGVPHE